METPVYDEVIEIIARELCAQVDWARAELAETPFAELHRAGAAYEAALGLIRHLRARARPLMGYPADYVTRLRANAAEAFRAQAREEIHRLLYVPFMGGDWPDGRGTLVCARPEILQVAGTRDDFLLYGRCVAEGQPTWPAAAIHSIMGSLRYLQAVWAVEDCPDEAILPVLAFLVFRVNHEWTWARHWGEAMLGTQGHNWFVAQYGTTWKAGLLFPEFLGFDRFQALCPAWFEREISLLFWPDGFTHEASVSYHSGTTDLFLDCVRLAELNGIRFNAAFTERLRQGYAAEWKLICPDGGHPPFGDCWARGPYFLDRLRAIAVLQNIPEAKYLAECWQPEWRSPFDPMLIDTLHYPSVGTDLAPAYQALRERKPDTCDAVLPDAGYYVMRQDWTQHADYCAIEAGPKGNLVTSHGHGAIFDMILYARGRQITVGNGKGPDGVADPERSWRHQTMSHTVAVVDDEHHLPLRSVYRFDGVVLPTVDGWQSTPTHAYFSGVHEAYERLPQRVSGSRRKVFYLRGNYWVLIDRFTAANPDDDHVYQQRFQMGVPCGILDDSYAVTEGEGGNLLFVPVDGARGKAALAPCPYPLGGEYADPAQLTFTQQARGSAIFVSVLAPFSGHVPVVKARLLPVVADNRALSPWEATGLEITVNGRRDVYVDLHMHWLLPWECGDYAGTGRLFHSRM